MQDKTAYANDDSPSVLPYRVGRLEVAVEKGFANQEKQLRDIISGFVTQKDLTEAKSEAREEHARIWGAINGIKRFGGWAVGVLLTTLLVIAAFIGLLRK